MADISDWGPAAWTYLHAVTFSYPVTPGPHDAEHYRCFFELVGSTLPCATCQDHYNAYVTMHPPRTATRDTLVKWLIDVHNAVRRRQGKSALTYGVATRNILGGARRRRHTAIILASVLVVGAVGVAVAGVVLSMKHECP